MVQISVHRGSSSESRIQVTHFRSYRSQLAKKIPKGNRLAHNRVLLKTRRPVHREPSWVYAEECPFVQIPGKPSEGAQSPPTSMHPLGEFSKYSPAHAPPSFETLHMMACCSAHMHSGGHDSHAYNPYIIMQFSKKICIKWSRQYDIHNTAVTISCCHMMKQTWPCE